MFTAAELAHRMFMEEAANGSDILAGGLKRMRDSLLEEPNDMDRAYDYFAHSLDALLNDRAAKARLSKTKEAAIEDEAKETAAYIDG